METWQQVILLLLGVELVMEIEEEYDIDIPDEDTDNIHTVGDLRRYIEDNT